MKEELEKRENLNFTKLKNINDFLEENKIYIKEGKEDSNLIKLIRILTQNDTSIKAISYAKDKSLDSANAIIYRLEPTTASIKIKDIIGFQSCISFLKNFDDSFEDKEILNIIQKKIDGDNKDTIFLVFNNYFINYQSIKDLDLNFDKSNSIYENIKAILNDSVYKIEFNEKVFKCNIEKINIKNIEDLIELKDNINLNFEENEQKNRIKLFVDYIDQIIQILKRIKFLEKNGCPFPVTITVIAKNEKITFKLFDEENDFVDLVKRLNNYKSAIIEIQKKFYIENKYFRLLYGKQFNKMYNKLKNKEVDICSYIRSIYINLYTKYF